MKKSHCCGILLPTEHKWTGLEFTVMTGRTVGRATCSVSKDLQAYHWINLSCEVGGCVIATHVVCLTIGDVVH